MEPATECGVVVVPIVGSVWIGVRLSVKTSLVRSGDVLGMLLVAAIL